VFFFVRPPYAGGVRKLLPITLALFAAALAPALADVPDSLSAAANQAYQAQNAKKPGTVVLPDGLQYRVLRTGFGKRVGPRDTVQVQFSGSLINGTVVDGTMPGLNANLAVGNVIRGLGEALQLMHVGDRWQMVLPPSLAFGAAGSGTVVPPNQAMVFDVTVVSDAPPAGPVLNDPGISLSPMNRNEGLYQERGAILSIPQ
jgi:FKBP-type peptidyl-prolyl cis-trans isomerase/Domain amino terminal to FKBP-type peptidyl-prolyl isomerase